MKSIRVKARGTCCVVDYRAMGANPKRVIGRVFDAESGDWTSTGEAVEVPATHEFRQAVRDGELWAADEASAAICGVKFDSTFGGEAEKASA